MGIVTSEHLVPTSVVWSELHGWTCASRIELQHSAGPPENPSLQDLNVDVTSWHSEGPCPCFTWGLHFLFPFSQEGALSCLAAVISEFAEVMASQPAYPRFSVTSLQTWSNAWCTVGALGMLCQPANTLEGVTVPGARDAAVNEADRSSCEQCTSWCSLLYPLCLPASCLPS